MKTQRTLLSCTALSLLASLVLLPSCSDGTSQTSTGSGGSSSSSSGDVTSSSSSSNGSSSSGMGGSGGNAGCTPGTTDFCYSGPPGTEIVGLCKAGVKTCGADGTYGPCAGEITPMPELCATMGDDDCDGMVNEEGPDCTCMPNTTKACYSGPMGTLDVGDCKAGTQACNAQGTAYGPCVGEVIPTQETCALPGDENCNGQINEMGANCVCMPNTTTTCYTGAAGTLGVGNCVAGMKACNADGTAYGPCIGEVMPQMEDCALPGDENCNGQISEGGLNCVCLPNTTASCYSGAAGTQGVGLCKAGTKACNAQGTMFGPCVGEVVPAAESCNTAGDDNCNGMANEGCSAIWSKSFGGILDEDINDVAVDAQGNIVIVGGFAGTVDFGGGPMTTPNGNTDIFVVKFDPQGAFVWGKQYGANGIDRALGVAIDALGNVVVTGIFQSTVDFGGGPFASVGGTHDIFVLALSPGGGHLLSRAFGGSGGDEGSAVTIDPSGNAIVVGHMTGSIDFGGGTLTSAGGDDAFIAKYSPLGVHVWSARFGDVNQQQIKDVAADSAGNVYFTGNFTGQVDFGGGTMTSLGANDSMLVKFSAAGTHQWSRQLGGTFLQYGWSVAVDTLNNVVVTGGAQGMVDFGLGAMTSAGNSDIFIAKYNSNNMPQWAKMIGDGGDQVSFGIKTDAQNNVVSAGRMTGSADFGGGPLTSAGMNDAFLAKFNGAGMHTWSKIAGDALDQIGRAVAIDAAGNIIVVGKFQGNIDFGNGVKTSAGGYDGYLVKYGP